MMRWTGGYATAATTDNVFTRGGFSAGAQGGHTVGTREPVGRALGTRTMRGSTTTTKAAALAPAAHALFEVAARSKAFSLSASSSQWPLLLPSQEAWAAFAVAAFLIALGKDRDKDPPPLSSLLSSLSSLLSPLSSYLSSLCKWLPATSSTRILNPHLFL